MPSLLNLKKNWDYVDEEELTKIYEFQYNDVFSKILLINCTQFMNVLEKQVIAYLYIIKKQPIISLLSRVSEYYIQRYNKDKEKVFQAYQIIKQTNEKDLEFLDKTNCFLHCPHSSEAFHTCGNKFILCNDFIFCLQCKKVYNEEQAKMFCDFCGVEYYTKLREIVNEDYENYFSVCFDSHCPIEKEEKLKCKNCKEDLYVDISKFNDTKKNQNDKKKKIDNLYCIKCRIIFKTKDINLKCQKCNKKYVSEIKIFNEFNNFRTDNLCLVHTLLKRKFAMPRNIRKRVCNCEILNPKKYKHNTDKGILLEGFRYGKKVIVCEKCFKIFNYYTFNWNCPECGVGLNGNNNSLISKELLSESTSFSYKLEKDKNNLKQISKYNTTASNAKIKNIFPNSNNKSEIKIDKKISINNNEKNNNIIEMNNSNRLNENKKNNSERRTGEFNNNITFEKENNLSKTNDISNHTINNNITKINSNRNKLRENKKLLNKINKREDSNIINVNDKNNQTCNLLINSINSSIKLKNNFNDNNYNNSNNKTCIMTFNEMGTKEKNDIINNNNSKLNLTKEIEITKILSQENKYDYVIKSNKIIDLNNIKNNNKEKVNLN
jgi:hypothetical protein